MLKFSRIYKQFRPNFSAFSPLSIHTKSNYVKIVEVGPRDGLQNEKIFIPTDKKIEFVNKLSTTGLPVIEVTSFVSPQWVKQMSDNKEVYSKIKKLDSVNYPVLIPNIKGFNDALTVGVKEIAVFASASEGFARSNTNASVDEILDRIEEVTTASLARNIPVRGYVSCIVGCPYDGPVPPKQVAKVTEKLLELGCYEISIGDTIGVGTVNTMNAMLKEILKVAKADQVAIHCHDTYGQGLVNTVVALENGISIVDSSVSGLGGCPFARGATGNVATEDVVYMLHGMGIKTGVDLDKLMEAGRFIFEVLGRETQSRVNKAFLNKRK